MSLVLGGRFTKTTEQLLDEIDALLGACRTYMEHRENVETVLRKNPDFLFDKLRSILAIVGKQRMRRYGIPIKRRSDFEPLRDHLAALLEYADKVCLKTMEGLVKDVRASKIRTTLREWAMGIEIGGVERRAFDVEPLVQFALTQQLDSASPEDIYGRYVAKLLAAEEQLEPFEEMIPGAEKGYLSKNGRPCRAPCERGSSLFGGQCFCYTTKPYTSLGIQYNWDYCEPADCNAQ